MIYFLLSLTVYDKVTNMNNNLSARAIKIVAILQQALPIKEKDFVSLWVGKKFSGNIYRILVATILSQSCTDKASLAAYYELDLRIGVTPQNIARTANDIIENCIRVCGLQRMKTKALKSVSKEVLKHKDMLQTVLKLPLDEARESLMALPGVGPKTADVVLLTAGNKPIIPVDTHVDRISKRLELVPKKGGYEVVRSSLEKLLPKKDYHSSHLLLIALGRRYCKAIKPLCDICPVRKLCPYPENLEYLEPI